MSQDLYFYKFKLFNEKVIDNFSIEEIKNLLATKDLEGDESLQEKLFEEIEVKFALSANERKLKPIFENKELLLHEDSGYYVVNDKLWTIIKEVIFAKWETNKEQKIQDKYQEYLNFKDLAKLEEIYEQKLLIIHIH